MEQERTYNGMLVALLRRWRWEAILFCGLLGASVGIVLMFLLYVFFHWPLWSGLGLITGCILLALFLFPAWRLTLEDISRYLDRQLPVLEESCGLLLRPATELSSLEQIQVARTETRLRAAVI